VTDKVGESEIGHNWLCLCLRVLQVEGAQYSSGGAF
jgi:hypothetical protein